jgi:hypothetical protein
MALNRLCPARPTPRPPHLAMRFIALRELRNLA